MIDSHTIAAERRDLPTHVDLCAQRYTALETRLARIERVLWALLAVAAASAAGRWPRPTCQPCSACWAAAEA